MSQVTTMNDAELDAFLGSGGTGVLALARTDEAYAFPVSYGYDAETRAFYFRLGFHPESQKNEFLWPGRIVSYVVSRQVDGAWQSVIARGHLDEVAEAAVDSSVAEAIRRVDIPFFTVFDRSPEELDFQLFCLDPLSLSGHKQR